jgi:hypothetical protein
MPSDTNIAVSDEVWTALNSRKRPGESFDDVLRRLLAVEGDDSVEGSGGKDTPRTHAGADVSKLDLPGSVDPAAAADAVAAVLDELRERGTATKGELVQAVMPGHDLGYDAEAAVDHVVTSGERYRGAWWRRVVKPALEQDERVKKPSGGRSEWRWTEKE